MIQDMVYEVALEFRNGIVNANLNGEFKGDRFIESFPKGNCGIASNLLGRYLLERYGIRSWYTSGEIKNDSHVWLTLEDHYIVDITGDQYKNRLDDYVLRLNWTTDENAPWSLKKIAEKRIEATLRKKYPQLPIADCWDIVADDSSAPKGLWQYICALTFSRPRDIIKLLKYCSQDMKGNKLTLSEVQSVEDKYSDWFYREFRDEAQSFLSCWKGALNCISEIAQGKDKVEKLEFKLSENSEVKEWCKSNNKTVMDVIKILFNYSVIGCINEKGRWIFKYKDEYFEFMTSYPDYCVHYGFCRKLRIPKSYDKIVLDANRQYK